MSTHITTVSQILEFNRIMTLKLLDDISQLDNPKSALAFQPGPQRAHIAWQIMHVAVTEELFATDRLRKRASELTDWIPQYQKGSVADDQIPPLDVIRDVLAHSRKNLLDALSQIDDTDLDQIPEGLQERGWTNRFALQVICWHEAHHQGQSHFLLNSWKSAP